MKAIPEPQLITDLQLEQAMKKNPDLFLPPKQWTAPAECEALGRRALNELDALYCRWQDEQEYEDWADYQGFMKRFLEANNAEFVKMTQRPFALTFKHESCQITVRVTREECTMAIRPIK